ncbi:MAG: pyridoxamine 5'-phosphate oxidase family protein [Gammaproteobacteria bacterium]
MPDFPQNERNTVKRYPTRGVYDRETIFGILDEALVCHVSFELDGQPFIIPTIHARLGDRLLLHGLKGGRLLNHIDAGNPLAIAVTLLDGLVLARTVFNHSMNYRSAVLYGRGRTIVDTEHKLTALRALTEHVCPGRWSDARQPTPKELKATTIVEIDIEDASAKIRQGPPGDAGDELDHPVWAGVLPFETVTSEPVADPRLDDVHAVPDYVRDYRR